MAGSATLNPNTLIDDLITDVIDGLREDLHPAFGVRPFRVYTVRRTWSGGIIGSGDPIDIETEITPQPNVEPFYDMYRTQEECGYDVAGYVKMTEVSLTYTQSDLLAMEAPEGTQHLIKIMEAHGQGQAPKYCVHAKPPYPDRVKDMGWMMFLTVEQDEA